MVTENTPTRAENDYKRLMKRARRCTVPWWDRYALRHPSEWREGRRYYKKVYVAYYETRTAMAREGRTE